MKASPAFQFYWSDFINGTNHMTPEEVGGYIRLLCYQWDRGSVPNDDRRIAAITRCDKRAIAAIRLKFGCCNDGDLRNEKLEGVRAEQKRYSEEQSKKGKNRWKNKPDDSPKIAAAITAAKPESMPQGMPNGNRTDALCTLSPKGEREYLGSNVPECDFHSVAESICRRYPRKVKQAYGIAALVRMLTSGVTAERINAALDVWLDRWTTAETEMKHIPYLENWVNARPWDDEGMEPAEPEMVKSEPPTPNVEPKKSTGGGFAALEAFANRRFEEGQSE